MATQPFDTHAAVKRLSAAGFSEAQAEALVTTLVAERGELATKTDIASVKADIENLRVATKADLKIGLGELKTELIKWMVGLIAPLYAILITLLALRVL